MHNYSPLPVTPDRGLHFCTAGLLACGSTRTVAFPVSQWLNDGRSPLTVAGAAAVLDPELGWPVPHSHLIPDALRLSGEPCRCVVTVLTRSSKGDSDLPRPKNGRLRSDLCTVLQCILQILRNILWISGLFGADTVV